MEKILNEIENLAHTLTDLKEIMECNKATIERCQNIQQRLGPRIHLVSERLDKLVEEVGKNAE